MRIVVTGATSFIGKKFTLAAIHKGWDVIAVVRKNSGKTDELRSISSLSIVELNMNEYSAIGKIVGACDGFVHFAWNGTRGEDRANQTMQEENYRNSLDAVKSMIAIGCKKIIIAGSQAEYGLCSGMITEDMTCNPNTQYGIYKLKLFETTRKLCSQHGIAFKEPRFFSIYGPGDYSKTLIMSMIDKMKKNEPCALTRCIQMWDFLYIDDAVDAVIRLCEEECADGAYNLGSGDIRRLKDYVEELRVILNSSSILNYGIIPYPATGMVSIYPSITKIITEVGWNVRYSFEDGINTILEAF